MWHIPHKNFSKKFENFLHILSSLKETLDNSSIRNKKQGFHMIFISTKIGCQNIRHWKFFTKLHKFSKNNMCIIINNLNS